MFRRETPKPMGRIKVLIIILALIGVVLLGYVKKMGGIDKIFNFSPNKEVIKEHVSEVLKENPSIIIEALQKFQEDQEAEFKKRAEIKIKENSGSLESKEYKLIGGNPSGDVTIVYFFDYNCGHCRKANATLEELIKKDDNVRVLYKEMPILGESSYKIAEIALAVYVIEPSKYLNFHNQIMKLDIPNDKEIKKVLVSLNIDQKHLDEALKDPSIKRELTQVSSLASEIGIRGTPAFLVGEELIPGYMDLASLQDNIKRIREEKLSKND
jgi:protein-disulfide isomerase